MKLILFVLLIFLTSCHVSRQVATSHASSDSIANHIRDSASEVISQMQMRYENTIRTITASGVTFNPTPCPDLRSYRASLDSIGKVNFDLAVSKDSIISALRNKITIDKNGAIKAEGAIAAAYRTNSSIVEENTRLSITNDSLWSVHDSDQVKLSKTADVSKTNVRKTFIPWWMYLIAGLGFVLWFYKLIPKKINL